MILGDPNGKPASTGIGGRTTLDDLFRRAAARRPDAVALIDPPNRQSFTDGAPRTLTYAQADRTISAIAGRLRRIGLHADAIVGLQFANTVESVLTLLAVLRAGMIAMPLPLLWRQADMVAALGNVAASALIVSGRVGRCDQYNLALQVAVEIFPIRHVCGFGPEIPDGVTPLDELFSAERLDPLPAPERDRSLPPGPAAHLAMITWDTAADGLVPVGRNHSELIAGGLAVLLEGRFEQDATILATLTASSFAGLATIMLPWLMVGGTLALHHPFDLPTFAVQQGSVDVAVLPGPLVAPLTEAGYLAACPRLDRVIGVWRAPERLARAPAWRGGAFMTDVQVFGEIGLVSAPRTPTGRPGVVSFGTVAVPRGDNGGAFVSEIRSTANGTIAMRGPMVPRYPFPPGVERTALPHLKVSANGFVDTGFACWSNRDNAPMTVTGPPPGMISVGGYRFLMRDLQDVIADVDPSATLAALPDPLCGHRLAGSASAPFDLQHALTERGANPLLVNAFHPRGASSGQKTNAA